MSSKSHELTATVADMIVDKRLSEQEENILKWAVDEVHKNKRCRDHLKYMLDEAKDHKKIRISIQHWALIKDLERALEGDSDE